MFQAVRSGSCAAASTAAASLLLLLAASCGGGQPPASPPASPQGFNVVLVSFDTLRADRLGSFGYTHRPSSPNIDALAWDGILFENCITACPWTTPAHLSLLTSLNPVTHGLTSSFAEMWRALNNNRNYFRLPDHRVTLAEVLGENGFTTAAFTAGGPLDPKIGFAQGFDSYDSSMFKLRNENVSRMLNWIDANSDRRFFLFWHHFEVHAPYLNTDFVPEVLPAETAAAIQSQMRAIADDPPETVWPNGAATYRKRQLAVLQSHDAYNRDVSEALYVGGVRSADRWLGRLIGFLRDRGLYDRTMIVVVSDHGEELGDRSPQRFYNKHGHNVYEEMVRVPLVIKLPGQRAAGTRVAQVSRMIDVMPTILDVAGLTPSPDEMQGASLLPMWAAPEPPGSRVAFSEVLASKHEQKSVRTERYKYIVTVDEATVNRLGRERLPELPPQQELYDIAADPLERRNLLGTTHDPALDDLAAGFYRALQVYLADQPGEAEPIELDDETIEKLKALGYIGG